MTAKGRELLEMLTCLIAVAQEEKENTDSMEGAKPKHTEIRPCPVRAVVFQKEK